MGQLVNKKVDGKGLVGKMLHDKESISKVGFGKKVVDKGIVDNIVFTG